MVGKRQIIRHPSIVSPEETALERYVPDLANWPRSWSVDESDAAIGQQILDVLRPFLLELLAQQRSKKTLRRDRDHLWMLGGELIRRRCDDPDLTALPVATLLFNLIEEDGGPLIWPRISESEQKSFDATYRKLYRYLDRSQSA
jgi:hypothetical protein